MAFSKSIDPQNEAIQNLVDFCYNNDVTTGKFTIGDEKAFNVFMRLGSQAVKGEFAGRTGGGGGLCCSAKGKGQFRLLTRCTCALALAPDKAGTDDPVEAMKYLREAKNNFKG